MPRYFFHIEHVKVVKDDIGAEHPNFSAAKRHAVKRVAEILDREPDIFWDSDIFRMTVAEADGLVLFTLDLVASMAPATARPSRHRGTSDPR
jgi:hypothetical protein